MLRGQTVFLPGRVLRRAPRAAEIVLVAILGALLAEGVWFSIYGTDVHQLDLRPATATRPAEEAPRLTAANLAGLFAVRGGREGSDQVPETRLNFTLRGVRAVGEEGRGTAIIEVPGRGQVLVRPGEEISPGVMLEQVENSRVIIRRSGMRESLFLTEAAAARARIGQDGGRSAMPVPSLSEDTGPSAAVPSIEDWSEGLRVEPVFSGGSMRGLRIRSDSRREVLQASALQPGDIVVSVNGLALDSLQAARRTADILEAADRAVLTVEREGVMETLEITPGQGG